MVDFSHLSAGNSLSSTSRDLVEEYGVSKPNSPVKLTSDKDMGESEPVPVTLSVHSASSSDSENGGIDLGLPDLQEVFRAAQLLSHKNQEEIWWLNGKKTKICGASSKLKDSKRKM